MPKGLRGLTLAASLTVSITAQAASTEIVSVSSEGVQGNDYSNNVGLSANGRFAVFTSWASNLVPNDLNDTRDVFIRDLVNRTTELVSVDTAGTPLPNGGAISSTEFDSVISTDGRYILFCAKDPQFNYQLMLRDRQQEETDALAPCPSSYAVSGSGERIAYVADSGNSITLLDLTTASSQTIAPPAASYSRINSVKLSMDGSLLAFAREATLVDESGTTGAEQVFAVDTASGQIENVVELDRIDDLSLSGDGNYVAFTSTAPNLIDGFPDIEYQVVVVDRQTKQLDVITLDPIGMPGDRWSAYPRLSYDGNLVVFDTKATNLLASQTLTGTNVLLFDRNLRSFEVVNVSSDDVPANSSSYNPVISADGGVVGFRSYATNLVPNDSNGMLDLFVRYRDVVPADPMEALNTLLSELTAEQLDPNLLNSLTATIESAQASLAKGNSTAANNKLEAFVLKVEAQRGKKIDSASATKLIDLINQL